MTSRLCRSISRMICILMIPSTNNRRRISLHYFISVSILHFNLRMSRFWTAAPPGTPF